MNYNLPGSSVYRIPQTRILKVGCHAFLQRIFPTQGQAKSPALAGGILPLSHYPLAFHSALIIRVRIISARVPHANKSKGFSEPCVCWCFAEISVKAEVQLSAVFHSATMLQDVSEAIQFEVSIRELWQQV